MPNTLAHIGVQGAIGRAVLRPGDLVWVLIGYIVPDVGWMILRAGLVLGGGSVSYELKLYTIVQTSLPVSLLLCSAVAALTRRPGRVFTILAVNALLHLLLDATQIKWANGVLLAAPFSWHLTSFGLYWPEDLATDILTVMGLALCLYVSLRYRRTVPWRYRRPSPKRVAWSALFLLLYLASPPLLWTGALKADTHFVETLRLTDERPGKRLALDRCPFRRQDGHLFIGTIYGDTLIADDLDLPGHGTISVHAVFIDTHRIHIDDYHLHRHGWRDWASLIGLSWIGLFLLWKTVQTHNDALKQ